MRLNRGTILLLAALLVVIVAVLVINNNQASAPGETPTPAAATGSLLGITDATTIVRYEVRNNDTGDFTALTKDSGGAWTIDATYALEGRAPEQTLITTTTSQITSLQYNNTFQDDQLATFGMDTPAYTILVTLADGTVYAVYIGDKSPTSARYYAIVKQSSGAEPTSEPAPTDQVTAEATVEATAESTAEATSEATAEATAESTAEVTAEPLNRIENPEVNLTGMETIYLVPQTVIDTLTRWLATPPYAPLPTPDPLLGLTAEPTAEVTVEPTEEATVEPTEEAAEATTEATMEAASEATAEPTAEVTASS